MWGSKLAFSSWHRKILSFEVKYNAEHEEWWPLQASGNLDHNQKWNNSTLSVRVQRQPQKKPNLSLSGELSNRQRRYRVSPDPAQTPLVSFPNERLLMVSVLLYWPERRKTSLGTVSTIIPHNSTDMQSSTHQPWKMCSFPWPAGGDGSVCVMRCRGSVLKPFWIRGKM